MSKSWTVVGVPRRGDGRTFHLGLKEGELSQRVLTVGDKLRAERIASCFDAGSAVEPVESSRGFTTFRGKFQQVDVSIVAIGMGTSMMDFFVREASAIVPEGLTIIRFGTCGILRDDVVPGTLMVAESAKMIQQNFDKMLKGEDDCYIISDNIAADASITQILVDTVKELIPSGHICKGVNFTADSFYSSQGREMSHFADRNAAFVPKLASIPGAASMEMESGQLLFLAKLSKDHIRAAACAIGVANRINDGVIDAQLLEDLELKCGRAVLAALSKC